MMRKIIVITGPTATGKTALGVELGLELGGEVVSADSMQVYKRMDIGTAKPTAGEMRGIRHHMLSVAEPQENYSVAKYVPEADACVQDILTRGKLPIIVGGTGLYIDSLVAGRDFADTDGSSETRDSFSLEYDGVGGDVMLKRLAEFDPDRARLLHASDKRRIVRAFEIYSLTGKTITRHDAETKLKPPRYDARYVELSYEDRARLYSKIDTRVDEMMFSGLLGEVQGLLDSGVPRTCTAMQAIGYKELVSALHGECGVEDAVERIKLESRRYAKRQLTWHRRREDKLEILWQLSPDISHARQIATAFLDSNR